MSEHQWTQEGLFAHEQETFERWRGVTDAKIVCDGAMPDYTKQRIRLLFILKEANDPGQHWRDADLRTIWDGYGDPDYSRKTWTAMAQWTACLLDGKKLRGTLPPDRWSALLRRVAVVNLKKVAGGSVADEAEMASFVAIPAHAELLLEQLALYRPHITICCSDSIGTHVARLFLWPKGSWRTPVRGTQGDEIWERDSDVLGRTVSFWHPARCPRTSVEILGILDEIGREVRAVIV